jgi:LPS sulfotransferase NodH
MWQVVGWALGDVRCLSALPSRAFYICPNWPEWIILVSISAICMSDPLGLRGRLVEVSAYVVLLEAMIAIISAFDAVSSDLPLHLRFAASMVAAHLPMIQEAARLAYKILNFQLLHVCQRFDWMDGQNGYVFATQTASFFKNLAYFSLALVVPQNSSEVRELQIALIFLSVGAVCFSWNELQRKFHKASVAKAITSSMPPLPIEFPPEVQVPFVILSFQRTGSNLLCGKLHNHPEVVMHNEIFNEAKIFSYMETELSADSTWTWDIHSRNLDPVRFLTDLFKKSPSLKPMGKAIGFKLFPEHWTNSNEQMFKQLLADRRIKKIVLRREDYLGLYVSKLRSDKTGHYITKPLDGVKVCIDPSAFDQFVDYYDSCYEYMDTLMQGQSVHRLTYEDLTGPDVDSAMRDLCIFLNVDSTRKLAALDVTVKQSTNPISNDVVNFAQVFAAFRLHPKVSKCFQSPVPDC